MDVGMVRQTQGGDYTVFKGSVSTSEDFTSS